MTVSPSRGSTHRSAPGPSTRSAPTGVVSGREPVWSSGEHRVPPGVTLDPVQVDAVAHRQGQGPLVVLGAPGTGTSTVLVECVAARVERDGVPPDRVLVLAPTRSAAAALRGRLSAVLGRTVREPLARTPHSYAFGLIRRARVLDGDVPPQLISGAEQDSILAELLAGHEEGVGRRPEWPPDVPAATRVLRGFRDELRDLLMRAIERGLGPGDLARLGRRHHREEWVAAALVLEEYLEVTALASPGAFDPAAIVDHATALLAGDRRLREAEQQRWSVLAVDDAQELTAAAHRLLAVLAAGGPELVLVGDPDAATQTFRGAVPRAFLELRSGNDPVPRTVILPTAWRQATLLREAAARVSARIGSSGAVEHRTAVAPVGAEPGRIEVHLLASRVQEASFVAQALRRLHLDQQVPWSEMAVILRSARGADLLLRALTRAGVPVVSTTTQVPTRDEPAVVPLRLALRCAVDPATLDADLAVQLLGSPLGGVDAVGLRRVRQQLLVAERAAGGSRTSEQLLVDVLRMALTGPDAGLAQPDEVVPGMFDAPAGEPPTPIDLRADDPATMVITSPGTVSAGAEGGPPALRRAGAVLTAGRAAVLEPGATGERVLWAVWQASGLAEPWQRAALSGGAAGARADRDLDAVVALFDDAARFAERLPHAGPAEYLAYLDALDVPADSLAERAPVAEAVEVLTPQGAAGRQWQVVAVSGLQEGVWPDLRLRGSLLGAQDLADLLDGRTETVRASAETLRAARRAVLDDELRLFHVAVGRARRHLLLTAVRSEEELPSPFLDLVDPPVPAPRADPSGVDAPAPVPAGSRADELRPLSQVPWALTLPTLVARLRAVTVDAAAAPMRREAAAGQLARLALAGVPGAHPQDWYGLPPLSDPGPLRPEDTPVAVSPSRVEAFQRCALRWMLEQAGGAPPSGTAQRLGTLVHRVAQVLPRGGREELLAELERLLVDCDLGPGWAGRREVERARTMVDKFATYVRDAERAGRRLVSTELAVTAQVGRTLIRGQVDRLEEDAEGRLLVVDLKTGRAAPSEADVARHPQLGAYQVLAAEGAFDEETDSSARGSAGAALVQLGTERATPRVQTQRPLREDPDPRWAHELVETSAAGMSGAAFPATPNPQCRTCPVVRCCPARAEGRQVGQ